jgi:hypothetical protein
LGTAAPDDGRAGNSDKPSSQSIVQKTITVEVMTPDGAWELKIEEVREVRNELWVFAKVERPNGALGAMMKSVASDQIIERMPDLATKVFVVGKTWSWANDEPVTWLSKNDAYERRRQGERLWRR